MSSGLLGCALVFLLALFAWIDYVAYVMYVAPLWRDRALTRRILDEYRARSGYLPARMLEWSEVEEKPETQIYQRWRFLSTCEFCHEPTEAVIGFAGLVIFELFVVGIVIANIISIS